MAKHTPGPWRAETSWARGPEESRWISTVGRPKKPIAKIMEYHHHRESSREIRYGESIANATLIAAAPELLELAVRTREALSNGANPVKDSMNPLESLAYDLDVAIAKAKGESR